MFKVLFNFFHSNPIGSPLIYRLLGRKKFSIINFLIFFIVYNLVGLLAYGMSINDKEYLLTYKTPNFSLYSLTLLGLYLFFYAASNYMDIRKIVYQALSNNLTFGGWFKLSIINFNYIPLFVMTGLLLFYPFFLYSYELMRLENIIVGIIISTLTACVLNELILFKDLLSLTTLKIKKIPFLYIICYSFIGTALYVDIGYVANSLVIAFLFALFLLFSFINLFILKKCSFQLK